MGTEKYYKPGSFYRICDRTGFATRAERTRQEWQGLIVRKEVFEPRQPQDFVRGVQDIQTVPLARPRQVDSYDGPLHTSLTADAQLGTYVLSVVNASRMYPGDQIGIALDNGEQTTMIVYVDAANNRLTIQDPLNFKASLGNDITNYSAVSPPNIG